MRRYVVQVIIEEGNDEFWESLEEENKTGCDEILQMAKEMLYENGFHDAEVRLVEFTDKG